MPYTFTPLATDTFQRADESPLNPANWTVTGDNLAIVSHNCVPGVDQGGGTWVGSEAYTGAVFTANQYISVVLGAIDTTDIYVVDFLLCTPLNDSTENDVVLSGDGLGGFFIKLYDTTGLRATYNLPVPPVTGDVFTGGIFGDTIFAYYNGSQVVSATGTFGSDTNLWLLLQSGSGQTGNSITHFTAGTVSMGGGGTPAKQHIRFQSYGLDQITPFK